ncbi:hypothetical protein F5888DRAFT_1633856 [Russula emetica]|nr:hypothetical protein F5888DRAFT_1633856 [Russula emetica]
MIKKERSNLLQRVDASHLHLWKVNVDFDAVRDKIMRREYRPDANDQSQPLQTVKTIISPICEVWPEPPPHGHVHVFAGLPPGKVSPTIFGTLGNTFSLFSLAVLVQNAPTRTILHYEPCGAP